MSLSSPWPGSLETGPKKDRSTRGEALLLLRMLRRLSLLRAESSVESRPEAVLGLESVEESEARRVEAGGDAVDAVDRRCWSRRPCAVTGRDLDRDLDLDFVMMSDTTTTLLLALDVIWNELGGGSGDDDEGGGEAADCRTRPEAMGSPLRFRDAAPAVSTGSSSRGGRSSTKTESEGRCRWRGPRATATSLGDSAL